MHRNRYGITWRTQKAIENAGIKDTQGEQKGIRRASVKDFHSLRTTWITMALSAGVPMELVRRVTGHATTDVVLKHYFRPGRKDFKKVLEGAMPKLMTQGSGANGKAEADYKMPSGPGDLLAQALFELENVKSRSKALARAVALVEQARQWVDGHLLHEESGRSEG